MDWAISRQASARKKLQRPSRKGVHFKRSGKARDPKGSRYGLISRATVSSPQGRCRNWITSMAPLCSIYGLYSTEDTVVRYIGQTTQQSKTRLQQHLAEATRPPGASHCHRWIRKVLRTGYEIGIVVLEENCVWNEAERKWIAEYRKRNPGIMTNLSDGGCGYAGKRSDETRQRMRWPRTEQQKERLRALLASPSVRKKIAIGQRGNARGRGEKNGQAVLTEKDVIEIRKKLHDGISLSVIGKAHGVTKAAVSKIRTGRTWRHLDTCGAPT